MAVFVAVEGGLTILAAPVIMFLLPQNAREAWWLNKEERKVLTTRLALLLIFTKMKNLCGLWLLED